MAESIRVHLRRFRALLGLVAVITVITGSGCGGVDSNYVGRWRGEREVTAAPDADPAIVGTYRRVTLQIQPDGNFEMIDGGIPKRGRVAGDRLEVMSVMDREPPELESWQILWREDRLVISKGAESIKLRAERNPDPLSSVTEKQ
jgi:hypothetical protein